MEFHEYANLFPMMSEAEIFELSGDIHKHGQQQPITIYQGKILDGRNRWQACNLAHIEPKTVEYTGDDPLSFVVSGNLHRRNLTPSQFGFIAQEVATLRRGGFHGVTAKVKSNVARATLDSDGKTINQAADDFGISRDTVIRARQVAEKGAPELIAAVKAGTITVKPAAELAKLPIDQQQKAIASGIPAARQLAAEIREHGADVVASAQAQNKPARITYVSCCGMEVAERAKAVLGRITDADKEFQPALRAVIEYCNGRLAKKAKH